MQLDFTAIEQWVASESRVLDLGCGQGNLLQHLVATHKIHALGVEIDSDNITACVTKGLSVIEQDIDNGLANFSDNSFDTVLLTQTLQAVHRPDFVLKEMLRVGREGIISFPNFGYWQARLHLVMQGKMPVSNFMPYSWYDTPNIHFCTVKDFEMLCKQEGIRVLDRRVQLNSRDGLSRKNAFLPNLFSTFAIYHVAR